MKPEPYVYYGVAVSNYDGDTLQAELDLGMGIKCKVTCRLLGLDAPEIKAKATNEKAAALAAKQRLAALLSPGPLVFQSTTKPDKYGRLLVKIWNGDVCVNDTLLAEKLVVPYDGGTKTEFTQA